ncbi:hypothetical protein GCM10011390_24320 [Aureimonas endophytica]|uniref:Uncharacterized protein n=1 Tax=Aureimonas endophytica TaxID=2027858 RepID=A0A916ZNM8_9HYPH|nr:hypothetical protein GCM10011390_24320 [Aureimonas endophytica]
MLRWGDFQNASVIILASVPKPCAGASLMQPIPFSGRRASGKTKKSSRRAEGVSRCRSGAEAGPVAPAGAFPVRTRPFI